MSMIDTCIPLAFWTPGPIEMGIIVVAAILLFGRRLPELGRSLGRSLTEFRKGVRDFQDEVAAGYNEGGESDTGNDEVKSSAASTDEPRDGDA